MSMLAADQDRPPLDQLTRHPVLELMRARKEAATRPGQHGDGATLAVAIEGGGMRGIVSAGMAAALETLGLRDTIDRVYGSSAGSLNGAFLIAGQALWGCSVFYNDLVGKRFLSYARFLTKSKPVVDMEYVIYDLYVHRCPLNYKSVATADIDFHCLATNVATAGIDDLTDLRSVEAVQRALLASTCIPVLAGPPVEFRGKRYLDATLTESIPLVTVLDHGVTHLLVLQSRPYGEQLTGARRSDRFIARQLAKVDPALVSVHAGRPERYAQALATINERAHSQELNPAICPIRPTPDADRVGQLEQDRTRLVTGSMAGMQAMYEVWTGERYRVRELMHAIPATDFDQWAAGAR
jgi:predicted patatin/cPLA2 family phospholipase